MSAMQNLLSARRFAPLFVTQFFGAFNDNLYKNALVILLTFQTAQWTDLPVGLLTNLAMGLFILPFFLFSASAGLLADKYDKAKLARAAKLLEMLIALLAVLGFSAHNLVVLLTALFLLGLQSTLFGPVKYAILPQHLAPDELMRGNALVEAATFVAILLGTVSGGLLAGLPDGTRWIGLAAVLVAVCGYLASRAIPPAPAPEPDLRLRFNPVIETWRCLGFARANRRVFFAVLGISWFWLYGAVLLTQFPEFTRSVLHGEEHMATLLLTVFAIGIGGGSLLCGRLAAGRTRLGLTVVGGLGMSLFGFDLAWAGVGGGETVAAATAPLLTLLAEPRIWRVLVDLLGIGLFAGLYGVPLYALMQAESPVACRARVIAANNVLNALFMVLSTLLSLLVFKLGGHIPLLFGLIACANLGVTAYAAWLIGKRESGNGQPSAVSAPGQPVPDFRTSSSKTSP